MTKLFLIAIAAIFLVGCTAGVVEQKHIAFAGKMCASNGGVKYFETHWIHADFIGDLRCNNGLAYRGYIKETP